MKTPEELAEEFLEEHIIGAECYIGDLAEVIRAAQNDALERAAQRVPDTGGPVMTIVAALIRALKHPVSE